LLTGHTGFKGGWLSLWLARMGAQVTGLALPPTNERALFTVAGIEREVDSHVCDIRNFDRVSKVLTDCRPEIVIHLEAQPIVRTSYDEPLATYGTNVMGTVNLMEAARHCPSVRAIVMITSDKCYENREWVWPYRETEAMGGHDPYSSSKGCAELAIAAWRQSYFGGPDRPGLASVRAGNVVGGGDWSVDRLVPDCMRAFSIGCPIVLRNPHAIRPWQHVLEPLRGYLLVAEHLWQDPKGYAEGWNFGPTQEDARAVSWVVSTVAALWGDGARWEVVAGPHPHEATFLRLDSTKGYVRLGWSPRVNLSVCLEWTVEWYRGVYRGGNAHKLTLEQIDRYERLFESGNDYQT